MGCGASHNYNYQSQVENAWLQVEGTVDKSAEKGKNLVIKRSGWKTIRIFVSSTFKDFKAEREMLVKQVFPDLRLWCESRRLHLVECDLRWGVPKDTTTETTLRTCLSEIDRCHQDNVMPFFVNMTSERCGWVPAVEEVPQAVVDEYRWIFGLSVTEMEIMHAAYRRDNPNSLFMIRNASFMDTVPDLHKKEFLDDNPMASHKMKMLKTMLQNRFSENRVIYYDCEFDYIDKDRDKVYLKGLDGVFTQKVLEFFKDRISRQYPLDNTPANPYQRQREAHESFMKNRAEVVLGRDLVLREIQDHIAGIAVEAPLVLVAGPGSGKSAVMARTANDTVVNALQNTIPGAGDKGWHVFFHFVGATPGSTDLELMLKRLLKELGVVNDSTMPKDLESTVQLTTAVLSNPNTRPTVIILDAVNQFEEVAAAMNMSWLPGKLAPQIRCVFSMIGDTPPHKALKTRSIKPIETTLEPLDEQARQEIVRTMLSKYNKRLDHSQMNSLLSKDSSANPLWLSIACEELRVYGVFEKVSKKIEGLADGLLNLLTQVLERFEEENGGHLLVATLCLLECSNTGLLETELLRILADEDNLMPKDMPHKKRGKANVEKLEILPMAKWAVVYRGLRTFLRPFGESGEGRLDFYHRSLSKAVRSKYFLVDDADEDRVQARYNWWHSKLANFFQHVGNIDRRVEEYPYQLTKIGDHSRLAECLLEWDVFDHLYNEDYSSQLLAYWRAAGGAEEMETRYKTSLKELENKGDVPKETLGLRYLQVSRVMTQGGRHEGAEEMLAPAVRIEQDDLGGRPERMAQVYELTATIYTEKLKLYDFVSPQQLTELRPAIDNGTKAVELRETLPQEDKNKFKLAKTRMQLAFNMESWQACLLDERQYPDAAAFLNKARASQEGNRHIDLAMETFKQLRDDGHLAEAIMTKAILADRGSQVQLELYEEALALCLQTYGENHILTSRLYINIGIYYEDRAQYRDSYKHFKKWYQTCLVVFGPDHPKSKRAAGTLEEPLYRRIRQMDERGEL
ncbi:PREDICTED: TPR repeat-containing protein DDB_G0287407-like isoform X1 [Branchiostoma belcheri]|uniref:TPR repeat-containing protein DDB_G0287407-like isoform X1 n=1 Tax=Branchiostoma belcheri TaxID=7741 RepID=A0A6P4ZWK0_BRABE|nr:PREDICTED: TPR repeat-containing protein DDB_G0287407-like isoform X1 [Branchiostoma belcheri]XP_019645561.1 PREDICTED: TPR repeat-containing protein DDB_G0287407-like isoform X1 [Branchiostoma belcheri]